MKFFITALLCLFSIAFLSAQNYPPINSGEVIAEALQLHNDGKYKEAIELYKKVPRNDTNYAYALYELAYSQNADKDFDGTILTLRKGLELEISDYELDYMTLLGNAIDDKGDANHAISVYDSALIKYPNAQMLHLNKSICLIRLQKADEAEEILQELLIKNPFYSSAHFRLGQCAIQKGQLVQAMMCFYTYLLNTPDGTHSNTIIKLLSNLSKGTDDVMEVVNKRKAGPQGNFALVEQIILSKIALDKSYKVHTDLDDPILRQLQVMMEKLEYDNADPDFYMQFYVPLLKDIFNKDMIEPASFRAFSDVKIDAIQKYLKNNQKKLNQAVNVISTNLDKIRTTRELHYEKRQSAPVFYHFDKGALFASGNYINEKYEGKWEFYHPNGNIKSTGMYINSKKDGKWTYYYKNGSINGYDNWKNGEPEGEDLIYNKYGVLINKAFFKNGKTEGEKIAYYALGHLYTVSSFKEGIESGKFIQYFSSGKKQIEAETADDALQGSYRSFHQNGKPHIVTNYNKSKLNGSYKMYYDNGQLEFEGNYIDDEPEGLLKSYHKNGKLKRTANYIKGLLEGEELEYNDEQVLTQKVIYKKGKAEGLAEYFDDDGKLFSTFLFDNNKLKHARYFDKTGKEISSSSRDHRQIELTLYNAKGFKATTVTYDDQARKQGKETLFYNSGKVKETNQYKDGMLEGTTFGYYPDGTRYYEVNYSEDEKNGSAKNYYLNGKLSSQGWYINGKLNGDWTEYNEQGDIVSITTYLNDEIYGTKLNFYPNGKPDDDETYRSGWLSSLQLYDTSGNKLHNIQLKNGSGLYKGYHFNNKVRFEGNYVNGDPHGLFKLYYFDGSLSSSKNFEKGFLDGDYIEYHHNGKVYLQGSYEIGKRKGIWKYFSEDGKKTREENYVDGELHGKSIYYYPNGKIDREFTYKNDIRHGTYNRFSPDGQLVLTIQYEDDVPVAYSYHDKNKQLIPFISLNGGIGKVKSFYSNGNVSSEMEFSDGKLTGPYKINYPDGKTYYYEEKLEFGLTIGKLTEYYPNGQLKLEYPYYFNTQHGPFKEYFENGKLKEEGHYYNGLLVGAHKKYNDTGKHVETWYYHYGVLINIIKE